MKKKKTTNKIIGEYVEKKDINGLAEYFRAYITDDMLDNSPTPEVSDEKIVTIPKEKDTKSEVSNDSWDNGNFVDEWDKYFGDTYGEDFYMNGADRRIMYKLLSKTRADERKKVVLKGERNRVIAQIRAEEREQTRKKVVKIADIIINNFKEL